ncbi:unnamed protein product [Allacma fusca]|uniref:DOMON domain-containing protein n=1 Tax=Allacma fusca TaxID=39272 RepID=A0A8J2P718_9HEXA|nr:unnamed protein product [Allacma fusca]
MEWTLFPWIFVISLFVLTTHSRSIHENSRAYPGIRGEVDLSPEFKLLWDVSSEESKITFTVRVRALGWIGFGISNTPTKASSDAVLGGVKHGVPYFDDYHFVFGNTPVRDPSQDWTLISASEMEEYTTLSFHRKFDTKDERDDVIITKIQLPLPLSRPRLNLRRQNPLPLSRPRLNLRRQNHLPPNRFTRTEVLSSTFEVTWTVDFAKEYVIFNVTANTTGYVGFGFSGYGNMMGADLIVGGAFRSTPYFDDYHSILDGEPVMDSNQSWILIHAQEVDFQTNLIFGRPFNTHDNEDLPIKNEWTYFIWALADCDNLRYHSTSRGSFLVNILDPRSNIPT